MPSRAKSVDRAVANLPSIPKELVNQFLTGPMSGDRGGGHRLQTGADRGVLERRADASPWHAGRGKTRGGQQPAQRLHRRRCYW